MIKIKVNLGERSYPILIGHGLIDALGFEIAKYLKNKKFMLITDSNVNKLYSKRLMNSLKENGLSVNLAVIPAGEKYKDIEQAKIIYKECIKNNLHRDSSIIALGGGVISDLAGFAAATYMRGVPLVNIPTTLVGQVDAAIGGKTGINFEAKNIIGSFYQPKLVIIDPNFLKTLPEAEIKNGLVEIIKYSIIKDAKLFRFLERNKQKIMELDKNSLLKVISRCCLIKARIVEKDEKENNVRAILNYGHTIGHAIERVSNYKIPHGKAVAIGMINEAKIARMLDLLDEKQERRIIELISKYNLVEDMQFKKRDILKAVGLDKKVLNEKIRFVLPTRIGKVCITNVPVEIMERALEP
jgi:3-dehydroquinate synthase